MKVRTTFFIILLCFFFTCHVAAEEGNSKGSVQVPELFNSIKTFPANVQDLVPHFIVNHDGDGEGEELPSSILYSRKDKKEYRTSMTITDLSLCKRPGEREICRDFAKMISNATPPALGTDITGTRIGGSGYRTVFLAHVDSVKFDGVDVFTAFIAGDSQDLPFCDVILYIYAQNGTNLIQLDTPVERCNPIPETPLDDVSYYKRFCVNDKIIAKAKSKAKELTEIFKLKTSGPAPEHVVFQKGKSGADLKGRIYGYDYKDYVIRAKKNQLMTLHFSSSNMYAFFRIFSINGRPDKELTPIEEREFSGRLPESGDYVVRLFMMRAGARKKGAMADYTLKVSIQ